MADQVHHLHSATGQTLYIHIRNSAGSIWNGSSFETYDSARWSFYDVAMTEQASSSFYAVTFPSGVTADATYSVSVYEQFGGSPALADTPVGGMSEYWDGTNLNSVDAVLTLVGALENVSLAAIKSGILITPGNPIAADGSGYVTITSAAQASIVTAVWAAGTRSLTTFGTLVADTATAVWDEGTRALTTFGSLAADTATAVWAAATRTLSAFAFTPTTANGPTIAATVAKLEDTLEDDGGTYRFTTNALEQAPSGEDATEAKQDTIIAAIGALNDPTAAVIAAAVWDEVIDTTETARIVLKKLRGKAIGKITRTSSDPYTIQVYAEDNVTLLFTLTHQTDGSARTVA